MTKPTIVRHGSLLAGICLAAGQTSARLSSSVSPNEFWTELTTGTGWLFVILVIPYALLALQTRQKLSSRRQDVAAGLVLLMGVIALVHDLITARPVNPIDVSAVDPVLLIVVAQVVVVLAARYWTRTK